MNIPGGSMSTPPKKRTRLNRVAPLDLPPGRLERALMALQRGDVLLRLFLCLVTAVAIWALTGSWAPPFTYRLDYTPPRDITAKVAFSRIDEDRPCEFGDAATEAAVLPRSQSCAVAAGRRAGGRRRGGRVAAVAA